MFRAAAATQELAADPLAEVELIPAGDFEIRPHDGGERYRLDDPDGVARRARELVLDIPIDYEHQSLRSKDNGREAPAAGWIKDVFVRDGAV